MSLLPNTTYYLRVKALNTDSESIYSNTMSVTTLSDNSILITPNPALPPSIYKIIPNTYNSFIVIEALDPTQYINQLNLVLSVNSDYSSPIYNNFVYTYPKSVNTFIENQVRYLVLNIGNLNANTVYYGKLQTCNKNACSNYTTFTFTTNSVIAAPVALGVTELTQVTAIANWNSVNAATSYVIDVSTTPTFDSGTFVVQALDTNNTNNYYQINVLVENTDYYFRLKAKLTTTNNGNTTVTLSNYSNTVHFKTLNSTTTIANLTYSLDNPTIKQISNLYTNSLQINWSEVKGATGYSYDISTNPSFTSFISQNNTTTLNYANITGLTAGTLYYIRIQSVNSTTNSSYTVISATTLIINNSLAAPQILSPTLIYSTLVNINWIKVAYASNYYLELSTDSNFNNIIYTTFTGDVDNISINSLNSNTEYYIRIRGLSNTVCSVVSNTISFITNATLPSINLLVNTSLSSNSITLNWSSNSSYTNYFLTVYKNINDSSNTNNNNSTLNINSSSYLGNGYFNHLDIGNVTNYILDVFLESNTTYNYFLTGITSTGDKQNSNIAQFTTKSSSPILQISSDMQYLEWTNNLNYIEVATDADFTFLKQGYAPLNITNTTNKLKLTNILESNINYYIRGYYFSTVKGLYSNIVSTYIDTPRIMNTFVTNTTAIVRLKKGLSTQYKIQICENIGGTFTPLTGYIVPLYIGDTDTVYLNSLTPNTEYSIAVQYFDINLNAYSNLSLPAYFTTNTYTAISDVIVNNSLSAINSSTNNIGFDRFTINFNSNYSLYLIEISRRSDFIYTEKYIELSNNNNTNINSYEYIAEPNTTYYIKAVGISSGLSTTVENISVTTNNLPSFPSALSTAPTIASITVLNNNQAVLSHSTITGATAYIIEISQFNTFTYLDTLATYTYTDTTTALLSNLIGSVTYYVRVYAYNANSVSPYSNIRNVKTVP
jgi:hypothetical protein